MPEGYVEALDRINDGYGISTPRSHLHHAGCRVPEHPERVGPLLDQAGERDVAPFPVCPSPSAVSRLPGRPVDPRPAAARRNTGYVTCRSLVALLLSTPFEQSIVTGQDPGVVRVPTFHVQLTLPFEVAVSGPNPAAFEGPDLYSTVMVQDAAGAVLAVAVA